MTDKSKPVKQVCLETELEMRRALRRGGWPALIAWIAAQVEEEARADLAEALAA